MISEIKNKQNNIFEKKKVGKFYASLIKNNTVIGIGTGSTINYFIKELGRIVSEDMINISVISTSYQSEYKLCKSNIPTISFLKETILDIAVDGADQVSFDFFAIKGYGGALLKEKIVDYSAKKFIVLIDESKFSKKLNIKIPIEIIPFGIHFVITKLKDLGGIAKIRIAKMKDGPLITENGNLILDCDFGVINDPYYLELKLDQIPGIISHGLFHKISEIYIC